MIRFLYQKFHGVMSGRWISTAYYYDLYLTIPPLTNWRIVLLRPLFDNMLGLAISRVWTGGSDRRGLIKTIAPGPARITSDFRKSLLI